MICHGCHGEITGRLNRLRKYCNGACQSRAKRAARRLKVIVQHEAKAKRDRYRAQCAATAWM